MKLVLYAFNVKTDILNKILQTIKNAVNVQLMRNQFLVATMKLKLGLYHEIHHGLTSEMIISTNSSTNLAATEKASKLSQRKSLSNTKGDRRRQLMTIDSVIKNSVESEFKFTQRQFTFFSSQEDVKTLTHCVADMPALHASRKDGDDHITSQAKQINLLNVTEETRKKLYQRQLGLLKTWEETYTLGKDPSKDPDSLLDDLISLKQLSKAEFYISSKILFRSISTHPNVESVETLLPGQIQRSKSSDSPNLHIRGRSGVMKMKDTTRRTAQSYARQKDILGPGVTAGRQQDTQDKLDKTQRNFLYDELNAHLERKLKSKGFILRRVNIGGTESNNRCYFQISRKRTRALLIEVNCDFSTNTIHFSVFSFNLELFDFHMPNQQFEKSRALQDRLQIFIKAQFYVNFL